MLNYSIVNQKFILFLSLFILIFFFIILNSEARASQINKNKSATQTNIPKPENIKFNWFRNKNHNNIKNPSTIKTFSKKPLGNGNWICSAAGFGKQSKCHRR